MCHQTKQERVPGRRDRDRCLLGARVPQHLGEHPWVPRFERARQEEGRFFLETELFKLGPWREGDYCLVSNVWVVP